MTLLVKNINCNTSSKGNGKGWNRYTPKNCRSYLDWYYCEPESNEFPLRDITKKDKGEPHYEDGTFNVCNSCNQRYLKKAVNDGERYIFFFTKYFGRNEVLKKRFGKKYCITGYFEISEWKEVPDRKKETRYAIKSKKPCFYRMEDSYELKKIVRRDKHGKLNARYAKKHLNVEMTEKIIEHFKKKKNRTSDYKKETSNILMSVS